MGNCIIFGNGGGGGSVNRVTKEAWSAMTYEEKVNAGLTIVGDETSIYGKWYDYSNTTSEGAYLPNSDLTSIITFANADNFDSSSLFWGTGTNPVTLQDYKTLDTDSVYFDVYTSGTLGYVDLGSQNRSVTVYAILKVAEEQATTTVRHLSAIVNKTANGGLIVCGNDYVHVTAWTNDSITDIPATEFYVLAMRFDGSSGHFNVNGQTYSRTVSLFSQYLTIGRTTYNGGNSGTYEEPANMYVKFLSVVDGAESDEVVAANVQNLMDIYNIS